MSKWNVVLSTTEPYNYVGMIQVRQGNKNTEVMEATIVENGLPYDLSECKVYFESVVGGKYPVQLETKIVDAKKGKINYIFDKYSMQCLHRQTANFIIFKGEDLIGTTQDFSYFVINAVSKTEGEMGSYWQSIEDLIADMTDFINENKGDFTDWMNERKEEFERWRQEQEHSFQDWREGQESDYLAWFESWWNNACGINGCESRYSRKTTQFNFRTFACRYELFVSKTTNKLIYYRVC